MNLEHKKQLLNLLDECCSEDNYFYYGEGIHLCYWWRCSFAKYDKCPIRAIANQLQHEIVDEEIKNMDVKSKEKLLRLLEGYCDDNYCIPIGHHLLCNEDCRFNCPIKYCLHSSGTSGCPLLDIRNQIRKECDE